MKAVEIALSIEQAAESTMLTLQREADTAQWAAEQLRKGATLPPQIQIRVFESHYESCLALKADHFMFATLACELAHEVLALQGEVRRLEADLKPQTQAAPPAPLPWWRRLFRGRAT